MPADHGGREVCGRPRSASNCRRAAARSAGLSYQTPSQSRIWSAPITSACGSCRGDPGRLGIRPGAARRRWRPGPSDRAACLMRGLIHRRRAARRSAAPPPPARRGVPRRPEARISGGTAACKRLARVAGLERQARRAAGRVAPAAPGACRRRAGSGADSRAPPARPGSAPAQFGQSRHACRHDVVARQHQQLVAGQRLARHQLQQAAPATAPAPSAHPAAAGAARSPAGRRRAIRGNSRRAGRPVRTVAPAASARASAAIVASATSPT